jgi:serine phosphatase RsbU (regulator of sigma subunit)
MFKKFRNKLLVSFILFTTIGLTVILINTTYLRKKGDLENIHTTIKEINVLLYQDVINIQNFFSYESVNPEYFSTGESPFIGEHKRLFNELIKQLANLKELREVEKFQIYDSVKTITASLRRYENTFQAAAHTLYLRGYKDNGTEGKMREYAHKLEAIPGLEVANILMLRRHEKDYIIRNEPKYIHELRALANKLEAQYRKTKKLSPETLDSALFNIKGYVKHFNRLVLLDKKLGIKDNSGFRKQITEQEELILTHFEVFIMQSEQKKKQLANQLALLYLGFAFLAIAGSIVLSFILARRITYNLSLLGTNMQAFVNSGFLPSQGIQFPKTIRNDELGQLIMNYRLLRKEILLLIHEFQQKVKERTRALEEQQKKTELQKEEIAAQRDELFAQNKYIEKQKYKVELQNKEIFSSFRYARLIQQAIMSNEQILKSAVKDSFVLFKPKEIISGDFHWVRKVKNSRFNVTLIALGDCTGHGVPGAMMSMLGIGLLNEIILRKEIVTAAQILNQLRSNVMDALQTQNGHSNNDGMDIAFIMLDNNTGQVQFAGANRPLYLIRDGEITIIKGDKMPIGKHTNDNRSFRNHYLQLEKQDRLYLFSDGYPDQFGGKDDKKFKRRPFRELLLRIHQHPMSQQCEILESEHTNWKGSREQTDDILVMGMHYEKGNLQTND